MVHALHLILSSPPSDDTVGLAPPNVDISDPEEPRDVMDRT